MPTAFVLAGGASLGAIEAGMLEALYERRIRADIFVGASAGALNAAFSAANEQDVDAAHELQRLWRATTRRDVFPLSPVTVLRALIGRSDHLISNRGLTGRLQRELGRLAALEGARAKLGIVVTDLLTGDERLLDSGRALPALLASASIPGIFAPVRIGDRLYVDGGVADNTPVSQALALGADTVYVLPTGISACIEQAPRTVLEMSIHAFNVLLNARLRQEICTLRERATLVVLPPPCPLTVLPTDFSHADDLIRAGLANAREALDSARPSEAPTDRAIARMEDPSATSAAAR